MHISPDAALLLFTLGTLLIYLELNRPGAIIPGAVGLIIALLTIATILHHPLNPTALLVITVAVTIFLYNLRHRSHIPAELTATLCLIFGFLHLIPNSAETHIHAPAATLCGLILGMGTSILTRIARRARANKGLD